MHGYDRGILEPLSIGPGNFVKFFTPCFDTMGLLLVLKQVCHCSILDSSVCKLMGKIFLSFREEVKKNIESVIMIIPRQAPPPFF